MPRAMPLRASVWPCKPSIPCPRICSTKPLCSNPRASGRSRMCASSGCGCKSEGSMLQVQYRVSDGMITSVWDANPPTLLLSQDTGTDPTYATTLIDTTMTPAMLMEGYYVQDGALVEKLSLTLNAAPNPFPADGVTICNVTVAPFVPCTLRVDAQTTDLTVGDPVLELTASAAHVFVISLEPMGPYSALSLFAEAT